MDMATISLAAIVVAFGGCLVAIAVYDLRSYTIPNFLPAAVLWLFVVAVPLSHVEISLLGHISSFLLVLAAGLVAFRYGAFGGGDVKSWAAVALWYDLYDLPTQIFWVTVIGAGLGLLIFGLRWAVASTFAQGRWVDSRGLRILRAGEPVPYGVAIAIGTILSAGHIELLRGLST